MKESGLGGMKVFMNPWRGVLAGQNLSSPVIRWPAIGFLRDQSLSSIYADYEAEAS